MDSDTDDNSACPPPAKRRAICNYPDGNESPNISRLGADESSSSGLGESPVTQLGSDELPISRLGSDDSPISRLGSDDSPISCLGADELLHIFSFLDTNVMLSTARRVCHLWNELCKTASLWTRRNVTDRQGMMTDEQLSSLLRYTPHLYSLSLPIPYPRWHRNVCYSRERPLTLDGFISALPLARGLKMLYLDANVYAKQEVLNAIIMHCPKLQELEFQLSKGLGCSRLLNEDVAQLQHCSEFLRFKCAQYPTLRDEGIAAIFRGCSLLEDVELHDNKLITDAALVSLADSGSSPKHLSLERLPNITCRGLDEIGRLSSLHTLRLAYFELDEDCLVRIASGCPNINSLTIEYISQINQNGFSALIENLKNLENLVFHEVRSSYVTMDQFMEVIGNNCSKLTNLTVSMTNISNAGMRSLRPLFSKCLQTLHVDHFSLFGNRRCAMRAGIKMLTQACVEQIRKEFPQLNLHAIGMDSD